jgi:hypothetical protein
MTLSIKVFERDGAWIAKCVELDVFSYGASKDQAIDRLRKVVNFYINSVTQIGDPSLELHDYFNNPNAEVLQ